jgi:hypothetical protein
MRAASGVLLLPTHLFPVQVIVHERGKSREDAPFTSILYKMISINTLTRLVMVL